ncbi:MAG: 30S ribosomal protein S8 [Candidatus Riflebacteria bacterium]|jgi:small subunit ribosomal protein S8|nr:30S ribosomal protein S8 [Candidatus Riflebacteria bacterium]
MSMTDPIGDMLTRIRNANMVKHESVEMPSSKMKIEIAKILKKEGYIRDFRYYKFQNKFNLKIFLKYGEKNTNILKGIERVSKPGRRIYSSKENIEKVLGGLGISILTTSKGVLTDKEARTNNVGGEVICRVW